ncbi:hypothetical protein AMTRI_Chr01g112350 [Amborella trichopoda]
MLSFLRCHKLSSSPPSRQRRGAGEFRERKRGREMAGEHLMKRIPRIKFPQRHSKSPGTVNPHAHQLKLCDFGSVKVLVKGEPNISYICSRYYSAPKLIFRATEYTSTIDTWSTGCVLAKLLLG